MEQLTLMGEKAVEIKKKIANKVEIIITNLNYDNTPCINSDGEPYTSVGFMAKRYGGGSPCFNEEEIKRSVESHKEWIRKEGDIPIVKDLRVKL